MSQEADFDASAWIGRHQAFAAIATKCALAQAVALKELKEARAFEPLGLNWGDFCKTRLGISRSRADELIQHLDTLGETYFRLCEIARISPETYRQISSHVNGEVMELDGEHVPITPENAPRIREAIQSLRRKLRDERERTCPNIAQLQLLSDDVLKHAYQMGSRTSPTAYRRELIKVAAKTGARWTSLSKEIQKDFTPSD